MKIKLTPEQLEQIVVIDWIKHFTDLPIIHIPNEGKRSRIGGYIQKRMGFYTGASDIFIPRTTIISLLNPSSFKGLWIELKYGKNKLTKPQIEFLDRMRKEGFAIAACWGAEDAINKIKFYYNKT